MPAAVVEAVAAAERCRDASVEAASPAFTVEM
jgi:hypothetical protein